MTDDPLIDEAESEEEVAFRAFVALARRRLDERRLVKTLIAWEKDTVDTGFPTEAQLPWVRLTPLAANCTRLTVGPNPHLSAPMRVMIETCVSGLDVARRMRFWAAIRRSLFPTDATKRAEFFAAMAKAGVRDVRVVKPAYGVDSVSGDDQADDLIISSGEILLLLTTPGY